MNSVYMECYVCVVPYCGRFYIISKTFMYRRSINREPDSSLLFAYDVRPHNLTLKKYALMARCRDEQQADSAGYRVACIATL